jgi:hypothetical protein
MVRRKRIVGPDEKKLIQIENILDMTTAKRYKNPPVQENMAILFATSLGL